MIHAAPATAAAPLLTQVVVGVLVATYVTILASLGYLYRHGAQWRRDRVKWENEQVAAMSVQTQALAVLVSEFKPLVGRVDVIQTETTDNVRATAVLERTLSIHQEVSDQRATDMRRALDQLRPAHG